jgi:hypothetical protein
MSNAPPIPPDQRTHVGGAPGQDDASSQLDSAHPDRRDLRTDAQSGQPGDADVNLRTQGRFGNTIQNVDELDRQRQDR